MDYDQAVAQGRSLLKRSEDDQWALAELTYTVLVVDKKSLRTWAADLGVSKTHVATLRDVWARYGSVHDHGHRTTRTFSEYYTLAGVPEERAERIQRESEETGDGVDKVRRADRPHNRVEQARELFKDRRGMREALRDREVRERFREIYEREFGKPAAEDPPRDTPVDRVPKHQLVSELVAFGDRISRLLARLLRVRLGREDREALLETVGELETGLGRMRSFLESDERPSGRRDRKPKDEAAPPPEVKEPADVPVPDKPPRERPPRRKPRVHPPPGDRVHRRTGQAAG